MAVKHYHHHYRFSYTTSLRKHFFLLAFIVIFLALILEVFLRVFYPQGTLDVNQISVFSIIVASLNTLTRLFLAYGIAVIISVPLALLITANAKFEKILLPVFDILQSIPVLAFFPIVVVAFVKANFLEGAAVFIIIFAMIGNLVFSMIGGLKTIPEDITNSGIVFGAHGIRKLFNITLPATLPYMITGSLLAWSQAWSIIIVAEALHTYIPHGVVQNDLFGLGSLLVDSFSEGKNAVFLTSLITMIIIITILNYFVWQKLLHLAERFRFD